MRRRPDTTGTRVAMACGLVLALVSCDATDDAPTSEAPAEASQAIESPADPTPDVPIGQSSALAVVVPAMSIDVATRVGGKLVELPVRVGDRVRTGDVVAVLRSPDLDHSLRLAEASAAAARSEIDGTRSDRRRAERAKVQADKLGDFASEDDRAAANFELSRSQAEGKQAQSRLAERQAEVARLRSQIDALTVRADFDGTIALHYHDPGQILAPQAPIARLVSSDLVVRFAVSPGEASSLALGKTLRFIAQDGKAFEIEVRSIAPEVDAASLVLVEAVPRAGLESMMAGVSGRVAFE